MEIIDYKTYINKKVLTSDYVPPDSAVIPQPGDKIIAYIRSQFKNQVPYFSVGIRSTNQILSTFNHNY